MTSLFVNFFSSFKNIAYFLIAIAIIYTMVFVKRQNDEISDLKDSNFELRNSNLLSNLDLKKIEKINIEFKTVLDKQTIENNNLQKQIDFEREVALKKEANYKEIIVHLQKQVKSSLNPSSVTILKKCEVKITEIDDKPPDETRKFLIKLNTIGD